MTDVGSRLKFAVGLDEGSHPRASVNQLQTKWMDHILCTLAISILALRLITYLEALPDLVGIRVCKTKDGGSAHNWEVVGTLLSLFL